MKKNLKRILSMLAVFAMALGMLTGCGEQKTYEVTLEMGENYVFDAAKIFGVDEKEAEKYEANLSPLDTKKAGTYEVTVKKGSKEYTVIYTVEDTKAPEVKLTQKYVFTHDANLTDFTSFANTKDASEVKESLIKFEKIAELKAYSDEDITGFTKTIVDTTDTETLLNRVDAYAGEEGIYKAVYVAEDAYGHKTAREVIVIYDTTAPTFDGIEDIPETVEVKDLDAEWTENYVSKLSITDNADGVISDDSLEVKMELTDEKNHTYTVNVSYTDRAGNKASAEYFFSLKEKKVVSSKPQEQAENTGAVSGGAVADTTGGGAVAPSQPTTSAGNGTVTYNGFVFSADMSADGHAYSQALANAGYYNPIAWSNGCYYMIVPAGESWAGVEFLMTWLNNQGLTCTSIGGGYFDMYAIAEELIVQDPMPIQ